MEKKIYDIIIIGGGASGLFLAGLLRGAKVLVLEKNEAVLKKIKASGGGKCNLTNKFLSVDNFLADKGFIKKAITDFNNEDLLLYFRKRGLETVLREEVFYFCKNSAKEVVKIILDENKNTEIILNSDVKGATKEGDFFVVETKNGNFRSKNLVVASGGISYESLGVSAIGYEIAKSFGHEVVTPKPALVGFTPQKEDFWFKDLSGVTIFAKAKVLDKTFSANLLFTHRGISGPLVLNASHYRDKGAIEIDFIPSFDFSKQNQNNKILSTFLPLPKRVVKAFLESRGLVDKKWQEYTPLEKEVIQTLKCYKFAPSGTFGFAKAEATKGGVSTNEIDENTLMSKKVTNLFFIGEVLDVTGELGGYNIQWAFSSAVLVSKNIIF